MRSMSRSAALAALAAATLMACSEPDDTVVRVGDRDISLAQFEETARELRKTGYKHLEAMDQEARLELLDGVIARELLLLEAMQRGYEREPAIANQISWTELRALMNRLYENEAVQQEYPYTREELHAFYLDSEYDVEVLTRHILCDTRAKALEVLAALDRGENFEDLVPQYTTRTILNRYGPRGLVPWYKIGDVYPQLREPLSTMPVDTFYPEPIRTELGYHVVGLRNRRAVGFDAAQDWLERKWRVKMRALDMERYIETLRQRYNLAARAEGFGVLCSLPADSTHYRGAEQVLFTWDGGQLTIRDYLSQMRQRRAKHPATMDSAATARVADNLAGRQIMRAEALRLGLDSHPEVVKLVEEKRRELLVGRLHHEVKQTCAQTEITEEQVRGFYDQNLDLFTRRDSVVTEYDVVRNSIRSLMRRQAVDTAMDELLAQLRESHADQIEIYPEVLSQAFAAETPEP